MEQRVYYTIIKWNENGTAKIQHPRNVTENCNIDKKFFILSLYGLYYRYSKIMVCWENEPELRPDFPSLREFFTQLLKKYGNLKEIEDGGDSKQNRNGNGSNQNATAIAVAMAKEFSTKKSNTNGAIQKPKRQYMNVPNQNSGESIELSEIQQEPIYANF